MTPFVDTALFYAASLYRLLLELSHFTGPFMGGLDWGSLRLLWTEDAVKKSGLEGKV